MRNVAAPEPGDRASDLGYWVEYWRRQRCHGWRDNECRTCEDYILCRDAYMTIIEMIDDKFKGAK